MVILSFRLLQQYRWRLGFSNLYKLRLKQKGERMVKYIENYALYEEIGSGVYGKVFRAINNNDKKEYAIKVIPITKFRQNKKLEECTVNEINILSNIEANEHIIRYYDMLKTSNNFYFIYEFCNGGTLDGLINKQGKLGQEQSLLIFKQLLDAFKILNKYNIMHRDMKPDNIFFHNGVIKLGDFGFCKNLGSADQMARTMLGSPIYMAPEVLKGEIYSNKADIWSLGVVLYQMIFGTCPFQSNSIAKLIQVLNTKQLQFPDKISPFLKQILTRMLTKDSIQRIGWMELFQIRINQSGKIQTAENIPRIMSLQDAKSSNQGNISTSVKSISVSRDTNSTNQPTTPTGNFRKTKSNNANVITNQNGPSFSEQNSQKNILSRQHKTIIEGAKLAMEVIQAKVPNSLGYSFLLLTKVAKNVAETQAKVISNDLRAILQKQSKQIKEELQQINTKMFSYEQKGLQDWRKYLRGKFFQEEKTVQLWYRMVLYLNGTYSSFQSAMPSKNMVEAIKAVLY